MGHGLARRLTRFARPIWSDALDALFPPCCRLCGAPAPDGWSCSEHRLPERPAGPRCGRCARALAPAFPDGALCAECRLSPPRFGRLDVLFDYRQSAAGREWILAFKHGGRRDLAPVLAGALARRVRAARPDLQRDALLVPVPLHPLRWLERGYDQARLLADLLAQQLGLELAPLLARSRPTGVQGAAGSPPRRLNVAGAFRARPPGRHARVLIVDDVVTSGATLDACAQALVRAGARRVDALALARAG